MNWNSSENTRLIQAVLKLETSDEARRFLRDLMTEKEIAEFAKRLRAAEMLMVNIPYTSIEQKTGLSSTTIARVSKWLNRKQGGYREIIAKLHHQDSILTGRGLS
ncbi:MAG: YerC/YecD family TrpR-related protein [Patescibacteria group bacterium]